MPNLFAHLVLYSFPLVVLVLFKRLPRHEAIIWSILGGYLFLPEQTGIDLPLLPELNKTLIPSFTAALMCICLPDAGATPMRRGHASVSNEAVDPSRRRSLVATLCLVVLVALPIAVFVTNRDAVIAGPRFIPGIREYDIFSMVLNTVVMLLPFFLARRYLCSEAAQLALLRALVVFGIVYSILMLIEIRMSPQLNRWIYGFHAHSFAQHIRGGGFRPMVFIEHGLRVGVFMFMAVFAAAILWRHSKDKSGTLQATERRAHRQTGKSRASYLFWCGWLFVVLFFSKNLGALLITLVLLPVLLVLRAKTQLWVAVVLAGVVLLYPSLRQTNLLPVGAVQNLAATINADRASSFNFRLDNEEILLERASLKPFFGWGGWGRSRIYDEFSGRDLSVTDGTWVIAFGESGWVGYLAMFGLLTWPIIALLKRRHSVSLVTSGLAVILAANLFDLIPNSSLTPLTWLFAGTVLGAVELRRQQTTEQKIQPKASRQPRQSTITQREAFVTGRLPSAHRPR